jgi:DNA-binding NarL/FixJ family response regulator
MGGYLSTTLVLLADDDVNDCLLFCDAIDQLKMDLSLKVVRNGVELLRYLLDERNPLPDFLFLDICMPFKNGFECLEEIRDSERLKRMNVIMYSTSSHYENVNEAFNKGANLYFAKSSTFQELINRLRRVFAINWEEFNPAANVHEFLLTDGVGI